MAPFEHQVKNSDKNTHQEQSEYQLKMRVLYRHARSYQQVCQCHTSCFTLLMTSVITKHFFYLTKTNLVLHLAKVRICYLSPGIISQVCSYYVLFCFLSFLM